MKQMTHKFWKEKTLQQMNREEWESLCDGCARCCLHKLEDEDTQEIFFTNVVCQYLETNECRCTIYNNRPAKVPTCVVLDKDDFDTHMMPSTCAYRLLAEGKDLPEWHPLVSGTQDTVFSAGIAVTGKTVNELDVDDFEHHLIDWIS